jgi:regulator of cell morphogenesis and NO signaling
MDPPHRPEADDVYAIRVLSADYSPPPAACAVHVDCFAELSAFDADLRRHSYLEREVLFPKALRLERARLLNSGR